MKKEIAVITGGKGDIARAIQTILVNDCGVHSPSRQCLDVTNIDKIDGYFSDIKPDILVNCAGFISPEKVVGMDFDLWKKHFDINLFGTVFCCVTGLKYGVHTIVNIGSSAAYKGKAEWSAYCASKAGVKSFTESLVAEGHNAYCLDIGRTKTKMREALFGKEDPSTLLTPEEVALVVFDMIKGKVHERVMRLNL